MQNPNAILAQILIERPSIHTTRDGRDRCIGLNSDVLDYLYHQLSPGLQTLETGCGLSTLVFALAGCYHQSIVPNKSHIKETFRHAERYAVDLGKTSFIEARSEIILPNLTEPRELDVILIDGGHAFPIPFIDWFYTRQQLVVGGLLVLDDVHLKTVNILYEFLEKQPEWEKLKLIHKTVFFRKYSELIDNESWDYCNKQPFNSDLKARINQYIWHLQQWMTGRSD